MEPGPDAVPAAPEAAEPSSIPTRREEDNGPGSEGPPRREAEETGGTAALDIESLYDKMAVLKIKVFRLRVFALEP